MKIPIVSIIGKPNVGKSTFFNRLTKTRLAITADEAGTTRDRIFFRVSHPVMDFFLVDTGGLDFSKTENSIEDDMHAQAKIAMQDADVILFMISSAETLSKEDFKAAELLRKQNKGTPVLLVANKCDRPLDEGELAELYKLGLGEPIPISALHNQGTDKLNSEIIKTLKDRHFLSKDDDTYKKIQLEEEKYPNVALVGRPNVGKSSTINALLNEDKLIVSDIPGTTRDSTDSLIKQKGKTYNFIDTAGLRRRSKVEKGIETFSVLRTLSSIERCDIAILMIDSTDEISHQDQQIAHTILEAHKGMIIVVNKWDVTDSEEEEADDKEERRREKMIRRLQRKLSFTPWAPVIFTSAVTKKNLHKLFEQIDIVRKEQTKRVPTARLNHVIEMAVQSHAPTGTKNIRPKLFYVTQTGINPPEFIFFVNKRKYFHFSYLRYLENKLREEFDFTGTPLLMDYREKEERFSKKKK